MKKAKRVPIQAGSNMTSLCVHFFVRSPLLSACGYAQEDADRYDTKKYYPTDSGKVYSD